MWRCVSSYFLFFFFFPDEGSSKSRMVANLYGATIKIKKMIRSLPPHLRVICLQGTKDATVDHRAALMLAKSPVQLDLIYLTGWSHYLAKENGFELLRDLVVAWIHSKLRLESSSSSKNRVGRWGRRRRTKRTRDNRIERIIDGARLCFVRPTAPGLRFRRKVHLKISALCFVSLSLSSGFS